MQHQNRNFASRRVVRRAFAKINLYLDILGCREDGFHELLTVMHALSLHDGIALTYTPSVTRSVTLRVFGAHLPTDARNLAYRAAEAFLDAASRNAAITVTVRKHIPIAAGLAGGSSDAAAVLLACNEAAGYPLSRDRLLELAASLGSDVPFCLVGGTQVCRGRGERMNPLALKEPLYAVIAIGAEHVSTPAAFSATDEYYNRFDGSVPHGGAPEKLCHTLANGGFADEDLVYNAFEPVILPTCETASALRERLLALGAYSAHMSGSGPSVFGLFRTANEARAAAKSIGHGAWYAQSADEDWNR